MELSQLQYFITVANCGKVTEAANILHVSQSAISMSISRLEDELGVRLFQKDGRLIKPTQNGYRLLEMVSVPMAELDHARQEMIASNFTEPDTISLSVEMPDFATHFEDMYLSIDSNCRFRQSMDTTETSAQKLLSGKVDFALTFEPFNNADVVSVQILTERVYIQLAKTHPLANRRSIRLEELKESPFVSFCPDYSFRRWTDGMCYFAGFRPQVCYEVCDTQSMVYFLTKRNAAVFVAQSTIEMAPVADVESNMFTTIPLENDFCNRRILLSYRKRRLFSPAAKRFLDFTLEFTEFYKSCQNFTETENHFLQLYMPDSVQ